MNNWRGGGGRGGWNNRRPWRRVRGASRGRGGGRWDNSNGENPSISAPCGQPRDSESGPPPPKRRKSSVKNSVVVHWKSKLPGYRLYYPDSPPQLSEVDKKICLVSDYLLRQGYLLPERLLEIDESEYFEVICEDVLEDKTFTDKWPEFLNDLTNEPQEVVNLWGAVMHKLISEYFILVGEDVTDDGESMASEDCRGKEGKTVNNVGRIHAGIFKANPVTSIVRINSSNLGKFVTIRGQIVGTGEVRAVCLQMAFLCKICEQEFLVDQPYGIYTLPTRCGVSEDCDNKRVFEPKETSDNLLMMDCRKIKFQDAQDYEVEKGAVPKTIECELTNGLVHQCNTGDTVTITGVVKMKKEFHFNGEQSLHNLYIEAIAMKNHRESERTLGGHWFSFSDKDYCTVRAIHDSPNLFKILVASLCPSIYGHELVKAALILSLFGGKLHKDDVLSRRSDINILMIGDPGIGKSQMLKVVTDVAPRGVYVCGTGSSIAGLTVTLVRDGDEYALEAGALVMSDKGVCCIDEFDKMVPQHPALLEAMEQQSVSIAKSGVFRTLSARATVIAAANPVGGHYNQCKSLSENIKISSPLLSRFDVIFILLDKANEDFDSRIGDHILGVSSQNRTNTTGGGASSEQSSLFGEFTIPLIDRLKVSADEKLKLIPHNIIRKFIAYARQYVHPQVSTEAAKILKKYYLRLREKHRLRDSTPITTRQLESLIRLTEARAKVELREVATADDANDILEIFESSLSSAFDDEVIAVSALSESIVIGTPAVSGSRNQAKRLVVALQRTAELQSKNLFSVNEIRQSIKTLGLKSSADQLIAGLNNEGYLLKKGHSLYQLQTIDF